MWPSYWASRKWTPFCALLGGGPGATAAPKVSNVRAPVHGADFTAVVHSKMLKLSGFDANLTGCSVFYRCNYFQYRSSIKTPGKREVSFDFVP